jgi:hypothetical protein
LGVDVIRWFKVDGWTDATKYAFCPSESVLRGKCIPWNGIGPTEERSGEDDLENERPHVN